MAHNATPGDYQFADARDDVKLGEICDVIFDHATGEVRYAVIGSGGLLRARRFLVTATMIRPYQTSKLRNLETSKPVTPAFLPSLFRRSRPRPARALCRASILPRCRR